MLCYCIVAKGLCIRTVPGGNKSNAAIQSGMKAPGAKTPKKERKTVYEKASICVSIGCCVDHGTDAADLGGHGIDIRSKLRSRLGDGNACIGEISTH